MRSEKKYQFYTAFAQYSRLMTLTLSKQYYPSIDILYFVIIGYGIFSP